MKKILLTLVGVICSLGMWADETWYLGSNNGGASSTYTTNSMTAGSTEWTVATNTKVTVSNTGGKTQGTGNAKTDGTNKWYGVKYSGTIGTCTVTLPTGYSLVSAKFEGYSNNTDNDAYIAKINDEDVSSVEGNLFPKGKGASTGKSSFTYDLTGSSFTFTTNAVEIVMNITLTVVSNAPSITASNATIKATESGVAATTEVAVTGANLTGSTLTATLSPAVDGLSVSLNNNAISSGAISATATLSYTATANVKTGTTTLTLSDGTTSKDYTVTYSAKVTDYTQQDVSEATTWDWTKTGGTTIQLSDETTPKKTDEVLLANIDGINNNDNFKSDALKVVGEYMVRDGKYFQGSSIKFNTTVSGYVEVSFSNTGKNRPYRYVNVNGNNTVSRDNAGTQTSSVKVYVSAGEVKISGHFTTDPSEIEEDGEYYNLEGQTADAYHIASALLDADQFLRIYSIKFTPADLETKTLGTNGYSTYCSDYAFTVSGVTVYKATYDSENESVTLSPVTGAVPAGEGVVFKGENADDEVTITPATNVAAALENALTGVSSATTTITATGTNYVLASNGTTTEFVKNSSTYNSTTALLHKAYLNIPAGSAKISVVFDDDNSTAVSAVKATNAAKAQVTKKAIVNGQLRIVTANGTFTAAGARVK